MHFLFFFNDTATTEIYTLSLHDALPISLSTAAALRAAARVWQEVSTTRSGAQPSSAAGSAAGSSRSPCNARTDRKSTRLNSSHANISYAVFCLKKKELHDSRARIPDPDY